MCINISPTPRTVIIETEPIAVVVTKNKLDVRLEIRQNGHVKLITPIFMPLSAVAALVLIGCEPQAPDLSRVNEIRAKNQKLAMEVREMEQVIEQAGDDTPNLQQDLDERERALVSSQLRITALRKREMELKLRQIKLNERLKKLHTTFEQLQSELANTTR